MADITIRPYLEGDLNSIVSLWEICELSRPWNDPIRDIERKLTVQRDLFLVLEKGKEILPNLPDPKINGKDYNKIFGIGSSSQKALEFLKK